MDSLVNALNDGSVEGAAAIASLASKNDSELQRMVKQYESTKEAQARWAGESANIITGYSNQMSALSDQMVQDVQRMDLYGPAMQAGANTIQGYINGVNSNRGSLSAALRSAANDAWSSFKRTIGINSPSKAFRESGHDSMDGYTLGVEDRSRDMQKEMGQTAKEAHDSFQKQMSGLSLPDINKELQWLVKEANEAVAAEVSGFTGKVSLAADARRSTNTEPQTITNDNGIVVNLNYYGTGEPTDIKRISRQIGIEAAKEMRSRGITSY